MSYKELEIEKELETLEKLKVDIEGIRNNTQSALRMFKMHSESEITNYKSGLEYDIMNSLKNINNKKEEKLRLLKADYELDITKIDEMKQQQLDNIIINNSDNINEFEKCIEDLEILKEYIINLVEEDMYDAYMNTLDSRIDYELGLETSSDYMDLIDKFSIVDNSFKSLNPVNPENTLTKLLNVITAPYYLIRSLFKDKASVRLLDLTLILLIFYLIINYSIVALSSISLYIVTTFATNYYLNRKVYSNFEDYYLIHEAITDNIVDHYIDILIGEADTISDIEFENKKDEITAIYEEQKKDLIDKIENEKIALEEAFNVEELVAKFKADKERNSEENIKMTLEESDSQVKRLENAIKIQENKVRELKLKAQIIPWYTPIYSKDKPKEEINRITGCPEAIIGTKHNSKYNFDVIHSIEIKDTSYLILHDNSNIDIINDTILLNMINSYNFYRPKLLKSDLIDTVELGRKISKVDINREYWNIITNREDFSKFLDNMELDISNRNNLINKEADSIHSYNKIIQKRMGILLQYRYIYLYNTNNILNNEQISKLALQNGIGITLITLFNLDTVNKNTTEFKDLYESFKSNFNFVIDTTCKPATILNNKSKNKEIKSLLD